MKNSSKNKLTKRTTKLIAKLGAYLYHVLIYFPIILARL
jgi:hypothetical protein